MLMIHFPPRVPWAGDKVIVGTPDIMMSEGQGTLCPLLGVPKHLLTWVLCSSFNTVLQAEEFSSGYGGDPGILGTCFGSHEGTGWYSVGSYYL